MSAAGSARPRVLCVPSMCALEWQIKPQLEQWAEVATFEPTEPGVPVPTDLGEQMDAVAERGLATLERLGWERCVVVSDEWGTPVAVQLARRASGTVEGMALGHACLSFDTQGERAAVNREVLLAMRHLAETDFHTFCRHLTQLTQGAYNDELAEQIMERVSVEDVLRRWRAHDGEAASFAGALRDLDLPLLLGEHTGCLLFTAAGYQDAAAAFPAARTVVTEQKPSVSPEFAEALRDFCAELPAGP